MTNKPDVTPKPKKPAAKKTAGVSASAVKAKAKPVAKKVGRPSIFSPALGAALCEAMANGLSLRKACELPGMPSTATAIVWLADDAKAEFQAQYACAREARADYLAEELLEIADDSSGDTITDKDGNTRADSEFVARSRLRVDSRKWLASKMAPKKYGDKIEHTGADGGAIQHSVKIEFV